MYNKLYHILFSLRVSETAIFDLGRMFARNQMVGWFILYNIFMFDLSELHCSLKLFSSTSLFLVFDSILDYSSGKRGNRKYIVFLKVFFLYLWYATGVFIAVIMLVCLVSDTDHAMWCSRVCITMYSIKLVESYYLCVSAMSSWLLRYQSFYYQSCTKFQQLNFDQIWFYFMLYALSNLFYDFHSQWIAMLNKQINSNS